MVSSALATAVATAAVLVCCLPTLGSAALVTLTCKDRAQYLDPSTMRCLRCADASAALEPNEARDGCRCRAGFAASGNLTAPYCVDCAAKGLAADASRTVCLPCAAASTQGLSAATRDCACAAGHVLTDKVGSAIMAEKVCVDCAAYGAVPDAAGQRCQVPFVCPAGATDEFAGVCLPAAKLAKIGKNPGGGVGYGTVTVESKTLAEQAVIAGTRCAAGWRGADGCELLANLCALQLYDQTQGACKVYATLLAEVCAPPTCLVPPLATLPWLFYQQSDVAVAQTHSLSRRFGHGDAMQIQASVYDLYGHHLGTLPLSNEAFLCEVPSPIATHGLSFGNNIETSCQLNAAWLVAGDTPAPRFLELFIVDSGNVTVPVPVRLSAHSPDSDDDPSVFYDAETVSRRGRTTTSQSMYRRFALYDNVLSDSYVRYATAVTFLIALDPARKDSIFAPLATVAYDVVPRGSSRGRNFFPTPDAGGAVPATDAPATVVLGEGVVPAAVPRTLLRGGEDSEARVLYVSDTSNRAILALMITSCCVAFLTSLVKAWAWQRRQVTLYVDFFGVMVRWFVYYCSHFSLYFFIVVAGAALYYFFWFKAQTSSSVLLPPPGHLTHYYHALLWTALATRCVDVAYRVWEQCTMWVFFLDWEQPRGKLISENKELPVSMWRMVFAANAFNQLQATLSLKIYATVLATVVLLEAAGLQGLTTAQPDGHDLSLEGSFSHPVLRVALTVMVWYGVHFALWLWDVAVYHRFFAAHAVREFTDLLSLANVSLFCLLERRHGYYIHGKSVHQFCEASVREFQAMLRKEEDGAIPMRGLTGQSDVQTFEILVDDSLAGLLWETELLVARERQPALNQQNRPPRRCYEYMMGMNQGVILTQAALKQIQELNRRLQGLVSRVVDDVQTLTPLHKSLGIVPFVHPSMPTRFYAQDDYAWTKCILQHLEPAISHLALLCYLAIDWSFENSFVAGSVSFVCIYFIHVCRRVFGSSNLAKTTMLDERFFL